jgi:hypothetical protein
MIACAGTATADLDIMAGSLSAVRHYELGEASQYGDRFDPGAGYSNIDNFTGGAYAAGGAAGGITKMIMDDCVFAGPLLTGQQIQTVRFSVFNGNAGTVATRARIRFWFADGAGGAPGTYYNLPGAVGFTFNAFSFASGVTILTGNLGAGLNFASPAPGMTLWAGMTFDNVGTATTNAQLDNFGMGIHNPPIIGSSSNNFFQTTNPGSFFNVANPAGAITSFNDGTAGNFGWEFVVPAPSSLALLGLGGLVAGRRRR